MASSGGPSADLRRRVLELQLSVSGQSALDEVNDKIRKNSQLIDTLGSMYSQAAISGDTYRAQVAKLVTDSDRLTASLQHVREAQERADYEARKAAGALTAEELALEEIAEQAERTAQGMDRLAAAKGRANAASGALGRGVLDLSRAVEDVSTGGVAGGLNNLPGIITNFGTAAGATTGLLNPLIATTTVLASAGYLAYKNWDTLTGAFGSGKAETEAEHFERLSKAVNKTSGELRILGQLEDARRAKSKQESTIQSLRDAKSPDQEAVGRVVTDAVARSGGLDNLLKALADVQVEMERRSNPNADFDALATLRNRLTDARTSPLAAQIASAAEGNRKDLAGIMSLVDAAKNPAAVGPGFMANPFVAEFGNIVRTEGPEAVQAKAALEARMKAAAEAAKKAKADAKDEEQRKRALISAWAQDEQRVATNQEQGDEKAKRDAERAAEKKKREDAQRLGRMLNAQGQIADQAAKDQQAATYSRRLVADGFAADFATHGGEQIAKKVRGGTPEGIAYQATYEQMLRTAANQEKTVGMLGEATARLAQMQEHNQRMEQRLNQLTGNFQRLRNRRPSLLPHPATR